mmetsp:Transcript_6026/g.9591  ORF Transcript_6026/g.9591 Transcript_6026/m.9591 type:complete len:258 (+) Transcript_6026:944-1717(+)
MRSGSMMLVRTQHKTSSLMDSICRLICRWMMWWPRTRSPEGEEELVAAGVVDAVVRSEGVEGLEAVELVLPHMLVLLAVEVADAVADAVELVLLPRTPSIFPKTVRAICSSGPKRISTLLTIRRSEGFPFHPTSPPLCVLTGVLQCFQGDFWMHDDRLDPEPVVGAMGGGPKELSTGVKMMVSNLGPEVTDDDLEVLAIQSDPRLQLISSSAEILHRSSSLSTEDQSRRQRSSTSRTELPLAARRLSSAGKLTPRRF